MTLLKKITTVLLCSAAPSALVGQAVELRSSDNFISVEGEITGFNGTMVTILTTVGPVSVPASEVMCFGEGCAEILATNTFGLTADAFADVVEQLEVPVETLADNFVVSFASQSYSALYTTLADAFATGNQTTTSIELDASGQVTMENAEGNETAVLTIGAPDETGDIVMTAVALSGTAPQEYAGPSDWAQATAPSHQMVGLRAFAVVTAPDVGVEKISVEQLAGIYAREITNWSQIDGADLPVMPLQLPVTSEVRDEMINVVMDPAGKSIAENVLTMGDETSIVAALNGFAGSISLVNIANVGAAKVLPVAGNCGIAVSPKDFNVASGDYPLLRPIMARFDTPATTSVIAELFDFAATDAAQDMLSGEGLVAHGSNFQAPVEKNLRLSALLSASLDPAERLVAAQMFQVLFEAERLSPTLTGGPASGPEGAWNRAMMLNLTELLLQPESAGREVIFAGYASSPDGPQDAIDISARAAADMATAFSAFAPAVVAGNDLTLSSFGFGGVSQATCYEGQIEGATHSRIEVWLK